MESLTATTTSKERQAFEIWARSKGINLARAHDGVYVYAPAYYSWLGWRTRSSFDKSKS